MRFAVVGSGAVGGYYGARLARAGHDVTLLARGAHLAAIRERGLEIRSSLGTFVARAPATNDPTQVGEVDVVLFAVKAYDNESALPMLPPLVGPATMVLSLQNGVDSVDLAAAVVGEAAVVAGPTYIATEVAAPGLIVQTGTHRRIVFGEVFGNREGVSERVSALQAALSAADVHAEAVPDGRVPLWSKFAYLAPFAGFTGAARLPIGPLWSQPGFKPLFLAAVVEIAAIAAAEGVGLAPTLAEEVTRYIDSIPPTTRSSLLIDLQAGKRIEVEALPGSVVRRGRAAGIATPIMEALYAVLKPYEKGPVSER
ncbi:MAG: 2-dehydropantoate 2-reductase [Acidobacteria bacterium]|nr:MAG: 2-dehydropantoate 2-reductase [Acidobacteriota bacterium]RPJ84358.1 MAG: 2-dehydropantoate 2-reductase [Acidobacteriota bacterium]